VDLPTYTNIWRIEKRLYKLYDFRLPMPLPINWIAVFAGITIPYIVLLIAIGLPFNHTLVWLYVLPPGVLTWLTTRPVIENKRLPELVESQVRYLTEPRTWVRLTPLSEKDQIVLSARVHHGRQSAKRSSPARRPSPARGPAPVSRPALPAAEREREVAPLRSGPVLKPTSVFRPEPGQAAARGQNLRQRQGSGVPQRPRAQERSRVQERARAQERFPVQERFQVQERPSAQEYIRPQEQEYIRPQERPRVPGLGQGPTRRAPALPPVRPLPPVLPVVLPAPPERYGSPVHAMPDVVPPATANTPSSAPAPASPESPASPASPVPTPAPVASATPAAPVIMPEPAPAPARTRGNGSGAPVPARARANGSANGSGRAHLEVSHDRPRRRPDVGQVPPDQPEQPVRPVQPPQSLQLAQPAPKPSVQLASAPSAPQGLATPVLPANPVREWPVPARPLRPVPPVTDDRVAVGADASPAPAAPATPAVAAPAADAPTTDTPDAPAFGTAGAGLAESLAEACTPEAEAAQAPPVAPTSPEPTQPETPVAASTERPKQPMQAAPVAAALVTSAPAPAPAPQAPAPAPAVQQVTDVKQQALPSIERALSGPARELNTAWGGKVKIVTGNGAGHGPGARDQEAQDRNRARLPVAEPRRILVLGCTSGAGQSVTTLMTASMLASLREHPVAAVDLHDGTLARYRAPAAWLEEVLAGKPPQHIRTNRPDGLHPTPKPNPARLDVVASHEPLNDGDEIKLAVQLNRHYPLTLLDPGASTLTRLLKVTDQLIVVVPANVDAAGALADTRDWLDNNGHADLAMQSVTVINGVSRRSLPDVESAEAIARGRSRAIVRVPWDDMLPVAAANPSTLRPQTRVAYTALAGVLVAGLAAAPVRKKQ
jgi:TcpE family